MTLSSSRHCPHRTFNARAANARKKAKRLALIASLAAMLMVGRAPVHAQAPVSALPFEADLLRLAQVLGTLAHLEAVCDENPDVSLHDMQAIIDDEALDEATRGKLAERYNQAYRLIVTSHAGCTASSRTLMARYREEGAALAEGIVNRFAQ